MWRTVSAWQQHTGRGGATRWVKKGGRTVLEYVGQDSSRSLFTARPEDARSQPRLQKRPAQRLLMLGLDETQATYVLSPSDKSSTKLNWSRVRLTSESKTVM